MWVLQDKKVSTRIFVLHFSIFLADTDPRHCRKKEIFNSVSNMNLLFMINKYGFAREKHNYKYMRKLEKNIILDTCLLEKNHKFQVRN